MQREGSTLSQMPGRLQVLSRMVVVLGQGKDLVVPAGVSGQRRSCVASSSQKPVLQTERLTSSQMPGGLQVLKTMVVVLGQGKNLVVPAGVSGQRRNCVVS